MSSFATGKSSRARFSINILENERGELLLLKRCMEARLGPGLWAFPAGHIEEGESPVACAQRELREEIGPEFSIALLQQTGPLRDIHYGGIYQVYLFHFRWIAGTIKLNQEHTDFAWVCKDDYRKYQVMDGTDMDILWLNIWPRGYLDEAKLQPVES